LYARKVTFFLYGNLRTGRGVPFLCREPLNPMFCGEGSELRGKSKKRLGPVFSLFAPGECSRLARPQWNPSGRSRRLSITARPPGVASSRHVVFQGREEALSTPGESRRCQGAGLLLFPNSIAPERLHALQPQFFDHAGTVGFHGSHADRKGGCYFGV